MILTNCAACAAPLAHNAPRCVRCWTRDPIATLDDLREAVTTLEDAGRTARRVFGDAHPTTLMGEALLGDVRATLRARETPPPPATS